MDLIPQSATSQSKWIQLADPWLDRIKSIDIFWLLILFGAECYSFTWAQFQLLWKNMIRTMGSDSPGLDKA